MMPKRGRRPHKSHSHKSVNRNRIQEYRHYDQLSEGDVGITEYLGTLKGFCGIIKARYSDFQVNEIDLEGNVAKLTDTSIPKDFTLKMTKHDYNTVVNSPNSNIPQETWEAIKALVNASTNTETVTLDIDNIDKEARTEIHNCIKSHFGQKVIASTVHVEGKRQLQFKKFNKEVKGDARFQWPKDKGDYVYFIVYKEKMDTLEAAFKISSALNLNVAKFSHAGNKDRRSITSQWFCVKKVVPWKLLNKTRNIFNIRIGNLKFRDVPLRLGQLKGNKFRIALRNVTESDEIINVAVDYLKENGFINYYGLQRFGNDKDVPTFKIGLNLIKGKWKEAIDQILKPKASDDPSSNQGDIVKAKNIYCETGDAARAHNALQKNKSNSVEGKLLEGLRNNAENDYVNALEKVPRSMRLLYLHSFQSLIWNKMVSKRLNLYGMKPVVGDLVLLQTEEIFSEELDIDDGNQTEEKSQKLVKALTDEDLQNYSMHDIVLPLPGYNVTYPDHMKNHYKETLQEYGIDLEMTKQTVKSYNLSGNYRKILEKVNDLSWSVVRYNNPTDNLILSDLQQLKGESKVQIDENGQYKAVILEFSLSSCSYATMLLRQIMKVDTATSAQSKLNDYHAVNQKNKVKTNKLISESCPDSYEKEEEENFSNSLLTDPERYEKLKNSIFLTETDQKSTECDDLMECPAKKQKIE